MFHNPSDNTLGLFYFMRVFCKNTWCEKAFTFKLVHVISDERHHDKTIKSHFPFKHIRSCVAQKYKKQKASFFSKTHLNYFFFWRSCNCLKFRCVLDTPQHLVTLLFWKTFNSANIGLVNDHLSPLPHLPCILIVKIQPYNPHYQISSCICNHFCSTNPSSNQWLVRYTGLSCSLV